MTKLSGKIALITGGTGALGSVVAMRMLAEGASVIVSHRGDSVSEAKVKELRVGNVHAEGITLDATNEASIIESISELLKRNRKIDILCNMVGGVGPKKFLEETSFEEWNAMMTLNLHSCFLMMKHLLGPMKQYGSGRVINIAALPGVTPEARRGGYGVAKAGVIALTKTAAEEVRGIPGLTVNAVAPSIILTEENKKWGTEAEWKKWVTPDQIAEMIVHLCSDQGVAINGQVINMYGKV